MAGNQEMGQSQSSEKEGLSRGRGCCCSTGSNNASVPALGCHSLVTQWGLHDSPYSSFTDWLVNVCLAGGKQREGGEHASTAAPLAGQCLLITEVMLILNRKLQRVYPVGLHKC